MTPVVSVGLPVYNGEKYLREAIESILAQSFEDFEFIICDNASTDRSEEICRRYAAQDSRIRYYRNEKNLGGALNFNYVFELSKGKYFKWAAHDDVCAPDLLSKCVAILDQDPSIVLCHTKVEAIDENGHFLEAFDFHLENTSSNKPQNRLADLILRPHMCFEVFGLVRASILRKTPLIGPYVGSDRNLLAELSLLGRFYEVPEYLLSIRYHADRSVERQPHDRLYWFDAARVGRITFVYWRRFFEHIKAIHRAPLDRSERRDCYCHMVRWLGKHWRYLRGDLRIAAVSLLKGLR